jgi:uncharacterized membrane protein
MPNLAPFHPQVVHFAVALILLGVGLRLISCIPPVTRRFTFLNHAAALLLILGAISAAIAVKSGEDAHGPVERIPGARDLVIEHEEYGKSARNVFLGVALVELLALGLARREKTVRYARYAPYASCALCVFGIVPMYEAAEHGGELVYSYGGGPGLRTGDPKDTERLLLAGLYNQSRVDRREKRFDRSAALMKEMVTRWPADTEIRLAWVESLILDAKDYAGALRAADSTAVAESNTRMLARKANLKADAFIALGQRDSARAVLGAASTAMPTNVRLKARFDSLGAR